jgi:hypothetical protein
MTDDTDQRPAVVRSAAYAGDALGAFAAVTRREPVRGQDAYDALGELKVGTGVFAESFGSLTAALGRSLDVYDVRQDDGTDPALAIAKASDYLNQAAPLLERVYALLDSAQTELGGQAAHPRKAES